MLIRFYQFWHGCLKLKGAGFVVRKLAPYLRSLQNFPLQLPEGQTIRLDFRDVSAWYWMNYLLGDKLEEAGLVEAVCRVSKPGDVIWDVGANCGLFSYLLVRRLPGCRIVFFEPNPLVYENACSALKPFRNVTAKNVGLSSRQTKNALLAVPSGGSAVATLQPTALSQKHLTLVVSLDYGDRLIDEGELPAPDIIKIDTEGHEAEVLAGLVGVISAKKPKVFFEHLSISDSAIKKLVPPNYVLHSISDRTGELTFGFDRSVGHNSALLPEQGG